MKLHVFPMWVFQICTISHWLVREQRTLLNQPNHTYMVRQKQMKGTIHLKQTCQPPWQILKIKHDLSQHVECQVILQHTNQRAATLTHVCGQNLEDQQLPHGACQKVSSHRRHSETIAMEHCAAQPFSTELEPQKKLWVNQTNMSAQECSNLHKVKTDMKLKLPRNRNTYGKIKLKSKWNRHNQYDWTKLPTQHKVKTYMKLKLPRNRNTYSKIKLKSKWAWATEETVGKPN